MSAVTPIEADPNEELFALIAVLHETEQRLEVLTGGEVDTVADRNGRPFMLRRAQEQLRHVEDAKQAAILNALPAHIALLDANGVIISVNESWRRFAPATVVLRPGYAIGANYIQICDGAAGDGALEAKQVANGIRAVLDGRIKRFAIDYPHHSLTESRWFHLTVTPLASNHSGGVVMMHVDVSAERETEEHLRVSQLRFRQMAEALRDVIFLFDAEGRRMLYVNPAYEEIWGRSRLALYANPESWADAIHPDDRASASASEAHGMLTGEFEMEYRIVRPDGSIRWIESRGSSIRDAAGRIVQVAGIAKDVTERRRMEEQFRQSQKMEAVGRLAGGVAHDFNNLLTIITGFAAFIHEDLNEHDPRRQDVEQIQKAAKDAAALTRQLLMFSRQQVIVPRVVALNEIVDGSERMLHRFIGEDIELVTKHRGEPPTVLIDPGQVEQVIMNLVVNARDAMPTGGTLTIETDVVDLDSAYAAAHWPAVTGRFAMLAVSDTGVGMDAETSARIFEPFFTTKPAGAGTGLGLATVYGIVKQSGGSVWVYSEPGQGSTFKIYLPLITAEAATSARTSGATAALGGTETILLAEDSDLVRLAVRQTLERLGYHVLEASSGAAALVLAGKGGVIDLLLTDVVMPQMSGRVLSEQFDVIRPGVKVLYMSGYTDDAVLRHGVSSATVEFIQKPFSPETLARKVRSVLDAR